jgi:hypothetical protein
MELCFVAMPFGRKSAGTRSVDFDDVYRSIVAPAITAAGLTPLRADEETIGGIIHKPMFERLILCRYAVVDLTFANANVFYELGVRHAARPSSTVLIVGEEIRLPFDVAMLRTLPYKVREDGHVKDALADTTALTAALRVCVEQQAHDSPVYQLLDGIRPLEVPSDKTDVFREQVAYSASTKRSLADARTLGKQNPADGLAQLASIWQSLGDLRVVESGVLIDLLLSLRDLKGFADMLSLIEAFPLVLQQVVMVREQQALALNRLKRRDEAERLLLKLLEERGPSSETLGILGRVYKDQWDDARKQGRELAADGYLVKAIAAYRRGFETDWRDHYPGINAVTLMELKEPPDPERTRMLPVVRYSAERRVLHGTPDYWDWATLVELAVLERDKDGAFNAMSSALAAVRATFEAETTARNLRLIREARELRGEPVKWAGELEGELERVGKGEETGKRAT